MTASKMTAWGGATGDKHIMCRLGRLFAHPTSKHVLIGLRNVFHVRHWWSIFSMQYIGPFLIHEQRSALLSRHKHLTACCGVSCKENWLHASLTEKSDTLYFMTTDNPEFQYALTKTCDKSSLIPYRVLAILKKTSYDYEQSLERISLCC